MPNKEEDPDRLLADAAKSGDIKAIREALIQSLELRTESLDADGRTRSPPPAMAIFKLTSEIFLPTSI